MMLSDAIFSSPESAFYEYQIKMENQLCQVCNSLAAGFHHGAYVCEACKKFFKRYSTNQLKSIIVCRKNCDLEKIGRRKCSYCRYKKCLNAGMKFSGLRTTDSNIDISKIPCRVCGGKSSGFHFGSLTCEGCKGFFRRAEPMKDKLECITGKLNCTIDISNRLFCKYCRYRRCVEVGMSKIGSRIGRQPNAVKYHCALEIKNYQNAKFSPNQMSNQSLDNGYSAPITDLNNQFPSPSNPPIPPDADMSMTFSIFLDRDSQAFFQKVWEAIDILQTPISEAENLSNVAHCSLHANQTLVEVWNSMMRHFDVHTRILVYFAKKIPGFNNLSLRDKRTMIQDSMYSIMLLNLAKDYQDNENESFNYFDFSKNEYEIILIHFSQMSNILAHVMKISRVVYEFRISKFQIGLLCLKELYKNFTDLQSYEDGRKIYTYVVRFFWISILIELNKGPIKCTNNASSKVSVLLQKLDCPNDLLSHILWKIPLAMEDQWCQKLNVIFNLLSESLHEFNLEHQTIIDQLKRNKPELSYPELYTDMFTQKKLTF